MTQRNEARNSEPAYILGEFPAPSQTFVLREIQGLRRRGLRVPVFALGRAPSEHLSAEDSAWSREVHRVPEFPGPSVMASHLFFVATRPARYLRAFLRLMLLPHRPRRLLFRALYVFLRAPWIAMQILRLGGVSHVHAHFAVSQTEAAQAVSDLLGGTFSFTAHARDIYATPNALPEKIRAARFVVTCSQYNVDYLRGLCPELPTSHVVLVRCGIDTSQFSRPEDLPAEPRPQPRPLLLSAGRLIEKKGFDVLVESCAILRDRGLEFSCAIAGDGPLRKQIEALIDRRGLGGRVEILGWKRFEDLVAWYRKASVFVLPSRITESGDRDGVPTVLVEALGYGVPCVSTEVSGIPELVEHEATGLLVPPDDAMGLADAMERVLRHPETGRRLAENGRRRVLREFDIVGIAQHLERLFADGPNATAQPPSGS